MLNKIVNWYQGKYVAYYNEPGSALVFMRGNYKRPWTARAARVMVDFYLREWKWVWGTSLAIIGLFLAVERVS